MRSFKIKVNGTSYDVEVEEMGSVTQQVVMPTPAPQVQQQAVAQNPPQVQEAAPAAQAAPAPKAVVSGEEIISPMPGTILDIKVAEGATVKEGEVLFILEALKMENELLAPVSGVVSVIVSKGDSVDTGELLAIIG